MVAFFVFLYLSFHSEIRQTNSRSSSSEEFDLLKARRHNKCYIG